MIDRYKLINTQIMREKYDRSFPVDRHNILEVYGVPRYLRTEQLVVCPQKSNTS